MSYSAELLKEYIEKNGITGTRAGELLGIKRAHVSNILGGRRSLTAESAIDIAEVLELDEAKVLAALMAEKAKSDKEKAAWVKLASQGTAAVFAAIGMIPNFAYWGVMSEEVSART